MTRTFGADNAIGWVQVRLRGGPRTLLTTTCAYAAVIVIAMMATTRLADERTSPAAIYEGWVKGVMGLQALVLLLFGSTRVVGAIRQDLNSGIIESHRLMPVAPSQAVLGYIVGGLSQALCLALANVLIGAYAAVQAGLPIRHWLGANLVLITFAVFIWLPMAFIALVPRSPVGLLLFLPGLFTGGPSGIISHAPGVTILMTPLLGASVFDMTATVRGIEQGLALAFAGQAVVGGLFFAAATRKYRRGDVVGFTPVLGLALLAAWVALSLFGTARWDDVAPRYMRAHWVKPDAQILTSLVIAMLIALAPVWASADQHAAWLARRLAGDAEALRRRPVPDWLVIVAAAAVALPLVAVADRWGIASFPPDTLPLAGLAVLLHLASSSYLRRALKFYTEKANALFVCWLAVLWAGPLVADVIRSELARESVAEHVQVLGPLSCVSPVGTMIALGNDRVADVPLGLAVQGAMTLAGAAFYHHTHPVRRRRRLKPEPDRLNA